MKPMNRRSFVYSAALTGASLAIPKNLPALPRNLLLPKDQPQIRLGVATYTFRNFTRSQMIADLQQLKISSINPKDVKDHLPADPPAEAAAIADYAAVNISLHAAGVIYFDKNDDTDIRNKFEYAKRANIKVIVAGPSPETLSRVEKFAREYDIQIAIHNHGPEDKLWPSPLDVLAAVKDLDPRMGCCIDVGHTTRTGTDVVQAIHAAGPRLFNVHMKDLADLRDKESQVPVGQGKMPVRQIFEALLAINYPGFVDLEYEVQGDNPMPGVTESLATLRSIRSSHT